MGKRGPKPKSDTRTVVFKGIEYHLRPRSLYYFSRVGGFLHRAIWEDHHGPVPDGYEIHHKDENKLNNSVDNLECLPTGEHRGIHAKSDRQRQHLARIRPLAAAWHGTEDGRRACGEAGKKNWENREPTDHVCAQCGQTFLSNGVIVKFCSKQCLEKHHYDAGTYRKERICIVCGISCRPANKNAKTCSRHCAGVLRWRSRLRPDG